MQISHRIKELRKKLNLSQDDFGARLGVTRDVVSNIELNRAQIKPLMVDLICKTYKVNKEWLCSGEGDMFSPLPREEEIACFASEIIADENAEFKRRLIYALSQLSDDQWDAIEAVVDKIIEQED